MDSRGDIDNVKIEKENAMMRYRRLRNIAKLLRVVEVFVALTLFSWSSTRLPTALGLSGEYLLRLSVYLLNSHIVFLIGNAIIFVLFLLWRQNNAGNNIGSIDLYDEYVQNSETRHRIASVSDSQTPPPVTEETACQDKQIVCSDNAVIQMQCDAVDKAIKQATKDIRRFQRTQSEKLKRELRVKPGRELRRSETETRRRIPPSDNELAITTIDPLEILSNEEFQRTIDAFIAKHQRFQRGQKMAGL